MTENLAERLVSAAAGNVWSTQDAETPEQIEKHIRGAVAAVLRELAADLDERSAELNAHELRGYADELDQRR